MKNIFVTIIAGIIIMFLFSFLIYNHSKNGEHFINNKNDLYNIAVQYLTEEEYQKKDHDNIHFFIKYDKFGITEKDKTQYAYMWVLGESYYLENEEVKSGNAYSMFFKFTFKNNKVISYENPRDGEEYTESIRRMCINYKMSNKILKYNSKLTNQKEINEYYSKVKDSHKIEKKDIIGENGLLFSISMKNDKCIPVNLRVYSDNKYVLEDHYLACKKEENCSLSLKYTQSIDGKYDYDVIKIIQNSENADIPNAKISEYEIYNGNGNIINMMTTDKNNTYLNEFLKQIKVDLNKCAIPEYIK